MHIAHMGTALRECWVCVICTHAWIKGKKVPTHCASSKCRSRRWNQDVVVVREVLESLKAPMVAERTIEYDMEA